MSLGGLGLQRIWRSKFLTDLGWYGSSTILQQAVRFAMSLVVAKHVGPEAWGVWAVLAVLILYFPNAHLGTLNAMNRDVPILRGANQLEGVERIQLNVFSLMILTGLLGAVGVIAYALGMVKPPLQSGLVLIAPFLLLNQLWLWVQFSLKAHNRFAHLGQQQFVLTLALLLCLPLAFWFGLEGFIWAQTLSTALALVYSLASRSVRFGWQLDWLEITRLMRIGLPIMAVGLLFTLLITLDRWLIGSHLGLKTLGLYAFAMTLTTVVQLIPGMVADQVYTRMLEAWGSTQQISSVRFWMWRQVQISLFAVTVVGSASALVLPFLVSRFFPAYAPSLGPFWVLLLYPVGLALAAGPANLLNTLGHQYHYLLVQASALPLLWALGSWLLVWGMQGVAWAVVLTFALYALALHLMANHLTKPEVRHGT